MADETVASDERGVFNVQLAPDTVFAIAFDEPPGELEVSHDGAAPTRFILLAEGEDTDPDPDDKVSHNLPEASAAKVVKRDGATEIRLISAGNPVISVEKV